MRHFAVRLLLAVIVASLTAVPAFAEKPKRGVGQGAAGSLPITGDYWAVIIGIDQYQHVDKLESAVKDAKAIRDVLLNRYGFASSRVTLLLDQQATRQGIEDALFRMGKQVGQDDSLFIYYAGHGQTDPDTKRGFWVPVDGRAQSPGTLISNARIRDEIEAMRAKHVYLVADSCFSGSLFGNDLPPVVRPPSQLVMHTPGAGRWCRAPGADTPRRCGAGTDYRSAASVQ